MEEHDFNQNKAKEHFVTIFNGSFLPIGLALHHSLEGHVQNYHLWILCVDELLEQQLSLINLPNVSLISLKEIENEILLTVKGKRGIGEYCWTLKPFAIKKVFDIDADVNRLTYIDTDLFFFKSPYVIFKEFKESGKNVMIIEHAFAPNYRNLEKNSGRFSAGFIIFTRSGESEKVRKWWEEMCIEWCYARSENGKFGDQKYLNAWPTMFAGEVHILKQVEETLAPWNVRYFGKKMKSNIRPVFYHFHALRIISSNQLLLYTTYKVGKYANQLYDEYISAIRESINTLHLHGISTPYIKPKKQKWYWLRAIKRKMTGSHKVVKLY